MSEKAQKCPICGAEVPAGASACPMCSTPLGTDGKPAASGDLRSDPSPSEGPKTSEEKGPRPKGDAPGGGRGRSRGPSASLQNRVAKLQKWRDLSKGLRVVVPTLPGWAEGMESPADEERWEEGVRGLERTAYKEISQALDAWQRESGGRLNRLEAYGLPSPTERRSLEEIQRALKAGDLDRALELYQKVANVVVMKERNLDDAIDSVEALKVLTADFDALGIPTPWKDAGAAGRLEGELRAGKVSEAHQEATGLRKSASDLLARTLPSKVNEAAERVAQEKVQGQDVGGDVALLAKAARALRQGRSEDALREMVRFQTRRTLDPFAMVEEQLRGGS